MIQNGFLAFQSGSDLNFDSMTYGLLRRHAKGHHEPRQTCFLSTRGILPLSTEVDSRVGTNLMAI
jgi:hypothetical protein